MDTKLIYEIGNLYSGYPYGVVVEGQFGGSKLHGPFTTETEAWNYGMEWAQEARPYEDFATVKVVKIETPQIKIITTAEAVKKAREEGLIA